MEEEKLSAQAAVIAVLKDNIHGLELDERCTQIAAFNVALTAWKLGGYQALPSLHLACCGLAPSATKAEWMALAGDNFRARNGMARLHKLFQDAPVLGSLINPRAQGGNLIDAEFHELAPLLTAALAPGETQKAKFENDAVELAVIAQGLAKAAELLAGQFTLVITNVPYLGNAKQDDVIKDYCERVHPEAKADLATCFVERCLQFCSYGAGSAALVTPQTWLFLGRYKKLRRRLLANVTWDSVIRLGSRAFETIGGEVVNVALLTLSQLSPAKAQVIAGLDASAPLTPAEKAKILIKGNVSLTGQANQLQNPDAAFVFGEVSELPLLSNYADSLTGAHTLDIERFRFYFWEVRTVTEKWNLHGSSPVVGKHYSGMEYVSFTRASGEAFAALAAAMKEEGFLGGWLSGNKAWGKVGVACGWMGTLPASLYIGQVFDNSVAAIIPKNPSHLLPIYCFCTSPIYPEEVRKINQKTQVANSTLVKVPFDLAYWQKVAAEKYPDGLPKPHSDDPTQWLFNGHPKGSEQPLHVAVARLIGYRWPRQTGSSFPDCPALGPDGLETFADEDGIVCLPPLNREQPAAARLRQLLTAALGTFDERALVAAGGLKGSKSKTLEDWLRDEYFEQHAKLFHDRPFIWHLWDGRPDGFHALVNYHRLDHATLQKLTYSYLGNWIQQQSDDAKADKPGAAERLGAARALQTKLAAILEGEAPLDIFVRWKPLKNQAQGWHPDINDGILQNIRPFLLTGDVGKRGAGLFRTVPLVLKDKDRGTEPTRPKAEYPWFWCEEEPGTDPTGGKDFVGNRWNNVHLTLATKRRFIIHNYN